MSDEMTPEYRLTCPRPRCHAAWLTPDFIRCLDFIVQHKLSKPRHTKVLVEKRMVTEWAEETVI